MHKWLFAAMVVLAGCESTTARQVEVTVPPEIQSAFSASAPGVVVSDLGADAGRSYALLCGQTTQSKLTLEQDRGFGCLLKSEEGTTETVKVWVQPMPARWNASSLCGARVDDTFYDATDFTSGDAGVADGGSDVLPAPDPAWVQASGSGTWKRDVSPCGGVLDVKVTLARP